MLGSHVEVGHPNNLYTSNSLEMLILDVCILDSEYVQVNMINLADDV